MPVSNGLIRKIKGDHICLLNKINKKKTYIQLDSNCIWELIYFPYSNDEKEFNSWAATTEHIIG